MKWQYDLEGMRKAGFADKYANHYLKKVDFERSSGFFTTEELQTAHDNGFWAENYLPYRMGLHSKDFPDGFLTDYDYERLWPLNDWMRIWINDKLTLKYMLHGTAYADMMPEYYYYMSSQGLRALIDHPAPAQDGASFLELLKEKKAFACKPCNGTLAAGFFKMSCVNGVFCLDDKEVSADALLDFVNKHPNYLYTEYLRPEKTLAEISDKVPTIRIVVLNETGMDPYIVPSAYIRFGTSVSGSANYIDGKSGAFTINAGVNTDSGEMYDARKFYINRTEPLDKHPDTGKGVSGVIPNWKQIREKVLGLSRMLFGVEWMGFDACLDENGAARIMEINSHPGIGYIQAFYPLFLDERVKRYFVKKINALESFNEEQRKAKNAVVR